MAFPDVTALIQFAHTVVDTLAMPYTLHVRRGKRATLVFAESEANLTADAKALAAKAVAAL